ncbi:MAG: hypothetical protein R3E50_07025 [Halioglobus sp.]
MDSFRKGVGSKAIPAGYPQGFGLEWLTKRSFRLEGHNFDISCNFNDLLSANQAGDPDQLYLFKSPEIIRHYLNLFNERTPRNIVELGIFRGGSVAFLQLLAKPAKLLDLELSPDRVDVLDRFITTEKLDKKVRVEYGVDQADKDRVRQLTNEHFGAGRCIDLVVDDASHLLAPTRSSFETLFPLIRPGGSYIVEDFAASHLVVVEFLDDALAGSESAQTSLTHAVRAGLGEDRQPLHLLAVEAMLAAMVAPGLIQKVIVDRQWLRIVRGGQVFDETHPFDLRGLATDHFALLQATPSKVLSSFLE